MIHVGSTTASPPCTMKVPMRIAIGQINPTVGDLAGNCDLMTRFAVRAADLGAGLIVFPELSLTGYPPRDLVEKPTLLERVEQALQELAGATSGLSLSLICGYVGRAESTAERRAANCAAVLAGGQVV